VAPHGGRAKRRLRSSFPFLFQSRRHPVAASLKRFGWRQPLVVRPTGEVIAGNTRLKSARSLGMSKAPVVRFEGSELDAVAYGLADNRTHEFSESISFPSRLSSTRPADLARRMAGASVVLSNSCHFSSVIAGGVR
jgi:hypothetical protein